MAFAGCSRRLSIPWCWLRGCHWRQNVLQASPLWRVSMALAEAPAARPFCERTNQHVPHVHPCAVRVGVGAHRAPDPGAWAGCPAPPSCGAWWWTCRLRRRRCPLRHLIMLMRICHWSNPSCRRLWPSNQLPCGRTKACNPPLSKVRRNGRGAADAHMRRAIPFDKMFLV